MNPLRLGIFSGIQQMRDRREERNARREARQFAIEDRKAREEDRKRQQETQALTLETMMRDKGYIPEAAAGPDASLSGRQLNEIVGAASGVPTVGMKGTGTRYESGPKGYRYDRMSPAAMEQTLEQRLREAQLRALEAPKPMAPRPTRTTDRGIEEFDPTTGQWSPTGRSPYQAPREQTPESWQTVETNEGFVQVNPRTGATRPLGIQGKTKDGDASKVMANVKDALDDFETVLVEKGSVVSDGVDKAVLQTAYENVQLQMKELFKLGVLAGPDLELMRRILNDPTSASGRVRALGSPERQAERTMAQIQQVRGILERYSKNTVPAAGAGRTYDVPNPR